MNESILTEAPPGTTALRREDGRYVMYRDGKPFYADGGGLERHPPGVGSIAALKVHGANSLRTWRADEAGRTGREILDEAHEHGLAVLMGLEVGRERPGQSLGIFNFDYDDEAAVLEQLERLKAEVLDLRDHPALFGWGVGNELNLEASNPRVWDAVNQISEMIHEVDPHHLTTTCLAGIGAHTIGLIQERCPDIDFLSFQIYGELPNLPRYLKETGWTGPYMVTEWGATGHWEVPSTHWGAPIENTSSEKAAAYLDRHRAAIASDTDQCIGSFVFLWGQKQERTPTWYSLFTDTGHATETVDVLHHIWTGEWPEKRSPEVRAMSLNGRSADADIHVRANTECRAEIISSSPNGLPLTYQWRLLRESTDLGHGGDFESVPEMIEGLIRNPDQPSIAFVAPTEWGAYRLFAYAYDENGRAGHANIPFWVDE